MRSLTEVAGASLGRSSPRAQRNARRQDRLVPSSLASGLLSASRLSSGETVRIRQDIVACTSFSLCDSSLGTSDQDSRDERERRRGVRAAQGPTVVAHVYLHGLEHIDDLQPLGVATEPQPQPQVAQNKADVHAVGIRDAELHLDPPDSMPRFRMYAITSDMGDPR
eukprot:CAMPEP_0170167664 /NCGR_PEP_ID=MMETSP0040_2-20121228/1004_1 /TAXON_ID=641309 /ORGANISM="Lotharella oceanica, Strain CCMP622" /LENGTH=165 /DNA_ID=CAMNT_0010405757 /DNA_START=925 /DNA_END=1424 /DNA_ORIENTATION=+